MTRRRYDNPFYHQPVFKPEDIQRAVYNPLSFWTRLNLMFMPTYCQFTEGCVIFFKMRGDGRVYITGFEDLDHLNIDNMMDYVAFREQEADEKTRRTLY